MRNSSLCYIEKDSKYLMLHRTKKKHDLNGGKWIGVGGGFEEGESPDECARREIKEETGLTVMSLSYRGIVTFVLGDETEYMHLFTSDDFCGTLSDCDEGDLEWVEKADVLSLELWRGDRIFLKLLEEGRPFFSLKLVYDCDELCGAVLDGKEIDISEY